MNKYETIKTGASEWGIRLKGTRKILGYVMTVYTNKGMTAKYKGILWVNYIAISEIFDTHKKAAAFVISNIDL